MSVINHSATHIGSYRLQVCFDCTVIEAANVWGGAAENKTEWRKRGILGCHSRAFSSGVFFRSLAGGTSRNRSPHREQKLLIEASPSLIKDTRETRTSTSRYIVKIFGVGFGVKFFISKRRMGMYVRMYACERKLLAVPGEHMMHQKRQWNR